MWAARRRSHDSCMRTPNRLAKIVLAAALGSMALTACGTVDATGKPPAKVSAAAVGASAKPAPAATPTPTRSLPSDDLATHPDPFARFLALNSRVLDGCVPGGLPEPPSLEPEESLPPQNQPGQPMPEEPEELPFPTDFPPPPPAPEPAPTKSGPVEEVPLTDVEKCAGDAHAERVRTAFDDAAPADYPALQKKLTSLDYPPSFINRMPDQGGSPRARIDLRFMGGRLVLDVTGTDRGVTAEPFGAPETEDVRITEVKRKP